MITPSTTKTNALFRVNKSYLSITLLLFGIEILIALFMHDSIIRPYGGDFLVVILIYCFIKSFLNLPVIKLSIGVLLFAYTLEILQYFKLVQLLGLDHSELATTIIGVHFEWIDMIAYTLGIASVLIIEKRFRNKKSLTL
tara:strand:+ start:622 stop:1041 length:420 start_codon:yes stop_codon:yes gene_type:complete